MDALALLSQVAFSEEQQQANSYEGSQGGGPPLIYSETLDPALRTVGVKRKLSANALDEGSLRDLPVPAFSAYAPSDPAQPLANLSYAASTLPSWQEKLLVQDQAIYPSKPEAPIFNETDGIIRCVCPYDDDDGFTIQCDRCFAWQHGLCVGISPDAVPDDYLCELCDPNPHRYASVDRSRATEKQQLKRRAEEGLRKARESLVATSAAGRNIDDAQLQATAILLASDDNVPGETSFEPPKPHSGPPTQPQRGAKRKTSSKSLNEDAAHASGPNNRKEPSHQPKQRRKPGPKPKAQNQNQASSMPVPPTTTASTSILAPPLDPQGPPLTRRSTAAQQTANSSGHSINSNAPQYSDEENEERFEAWQFEYTPITSNQWSDETAVESVRAALQNWFIRDLGGEQESDHSGKGTPQKLERVTCERNRLGKATWKHLTLPKGDTDEAMDEDVLANEPGLFEEYDPDEDAALSSPIGAVEIDSLPTTVKVAVKSLASASFSLAPPLSQPFSTGSTTAPSMSCPYPRALQHALFSTHTIPAGAFIAPVYGEVLSAILYRKDPVNQYATLGITKPSVRTLSAPWSVVIDQRRFGSETRFARNGCHPNAVLRPVILTPKSQNKNLPDDEETIDVTFALFALTDISKRDEIVLPWEWDDRHVVHSLPSLLSLSTAEAENVEPTPCLSRKMAAVSLTLFGVTACACEKRKDCALAWMWKLACASQPSGVGGNNRREIDEEGIEERMVTALTGTAAGYITQGKKNQKGKKPELGPLLEMKRGWVTEEENPMSTGQPDISMEVDFAPEPEAIREESALLPKSAARKSKRTIDYSSSEEEIVRPPKRKQTAKPAQIVSRGIEVLQQNAEPVESAQATSVASMSESTLSYLAPISMLPEGSSLGLMFDEPTDVHDVQEVTLPSTTKEPTPPLLPEPARELSPPIIKEATPPPAPPRVKLSFAAFRQRMAAVKPTDKEEEDYQSQAAPVHTLQRSPESSHQSSAKSEIRNIMADFSSREISRAPSVEAATKSIDIESPYSPPSYPHNVSFDEDDDADGIPIPADTIEDDWTTQGPRHSVYSRRSSPLPHSDTPRSGYFPPTTTFVRDGPDPFVRYSSPAYQQKDYSPPRPAPTPRQARSLREYETPVEYRPEDADQLHSTSAPRSPERERRDWSSGYKNHRREESPVPQGSPRSPTSPYPSTSPRGSFRPVPTGPSAFVVRPPVAPRRPNGHPNAPYRPPPSSYSRPPAVYSRPDPIDAPKAPKSFQAGSSSRDRAAWPPRDIRDAPRGPAPSVPARSRGNCPSALVQLIEDYLLDHQQEVAVDGRVQEADFVAEEEGFREDESMYACHIAYQGRMSIYGIVDL